ncbi:LacI family DNA-binding transcriptional regulator [Bacteroides sp.]|uniref:LacI family DNA-binding transcriptional regulator n=1 Tax=Bacteroides sp. TaxID=29523 RepID=UPI00258639D3|nr:LacI family DNA-binding transcriptional regulator [Bacteroides sp.]
MKCSLKDIAKSLNLSVTTVSWVLSGNGDNRHISPETQELVKKKAKEMNYEPNLLAKSLSNGSTKTIGLIIPSISDLFYAQIAKSVELEAEKSGYTIIFCSSESDSKREASLIKTLRQKRVDGIIIAPTKKSDVYIKNMVEEDFPLVLFDRYYPEIKTNYVIIDNEESSYQVVRKVIEEGRKKIAIITTNSYLLLMKERYKGYKRALNEKGIQLDKSLFVEVKVNDYESELKLAFDDLFSKHPDIDGFFFTTHILAIEALTYLSVRYHDMNTRFGFACIHEAPLLRTLAPNMKVALMPIDEIGRMSASILMQDISNQRKKKTNIVQPEKITLVLSSKIL